MKLRKLFAFVLPAVLCLTALPDRTFATTTNELVDSGLDYTESTETIDNPGAGYTSPLWMSAAPDDTPIFNPTGNLVLLMVDLGAYSSGSNGTTAEDGTYTEGVDYDLDETFFTNLRATLDNCRRNGCIVALRFRYDDVGKRDPEPSSFDQMVEHIYQIRDDGLLEEYRDIIAFVESGIVGSWGEHWGGKYCSFEDKAKILDILLDVVPKEIPVTVRTPMTFVTWAGITEEELATYTPEPGSDAARVCLYNDGYMGSDTDLGTYHDRDRDTTWVGRQALTSYFGGEFSGNLEFTKQYDTYLPENAIPEMYKTHLSYINSNIYQLYKDYTFGEVYDVENVDNSAYYGETVYKFMRDHIGYRFVIRDCDLSAQVAQGGILTIQADIENTGFANPLMEQKAEILLEKDGNYIRAEVDVNTKEWYSCTTVSPSLSLRLPAGLEAGQWNVYFKLSSGNNTLDEMHLRSVKFANNDTWSSALGANYMGSFTVTATASPIASGNTFYQVNAQQKVEAGGEMFTVNNICAADGFANVPSEREESLLYADAEGNQLYLSNDDKYLYVMAEISHEAGAPVYNLSFTNHATGKEYWIYYQGNGFVYFNQGTPPYGVVQKHNGTTVEFRLPFGDLMGIEAGVTLSNVRVNIQDESNSWVSVGSVTAEEYVVTDKFNIYSAMQPVHLSDGDTHTMTAHTTAEKVTYQWLHDGEEIEGATTAQYTMTAASGSAGIYSVRIISQGGTERIVDVCKVVYTSRIRGDVNADGIFSMADIVMLQKWLICTQNATLADWQAGDLCDDDILNVADLSIMKREFINAAASPTEREFRFSVSDGLFDQENTDTLSLSYPDGLETYTVWQAEESGDHYCNGVCLAAYKGKLYCQWQSSAKDEDSADTRVMYSVSSDMGKTWSEPQQLIQDIAVEGVPGDDTAYCSSGGWLATDDQLVAYINVWPGINPRGGYTYYMTSQDGSSWSEPQPVMMADGTPMNGIIEQDPHVLASGRVVNAAHFQDGLVVCPIYTDDPNGITGWKKGDFTPTVSGSTSVEMEPSLFVQSDGTIVMIFRDQNSSYTKLVSYSLDDGITWSKVMTTEMPDARTKQSAGNLSDGTAFMVGCPVNNKLRSPLAVTLSADGKTFDHAFLIRSTSSDPELIYEGTAKREGFHYTKSLVYGGYLYVGYATNKEAVEISIIPESSLMLN